jgi:FKBP-type peptidyl-prolyl cis-trans isomerase
MSAKDKTTRVIILVIVVTFALSSLGLSGLVIWDAVKGSDETSSQDIQKQLEEQQQNSSAGKKLEGFSPVQSADKLEKIDLQKGDGKEADKESEVTAHYTGALAKTGVIFESSLDSGQPATFPLKGVIKGWQEGVPGMQEGGKRRLIIPASLAYGEQGSPPKIGPNEPLVFDIELISVK